MRSPHPRGFAYLALYLILSLVILRADSGNGDIEIRGEPGMFVLLLAQQPRR